jgi:hypothetical protein
MTAWVVELRRSGVRVRTKTGYTLSVYPWTDDDRQVYLPMRIGYANTLTKMQGATLEHMTIYFDVANIPAAAYVALSRVERDEDWQFVGNPGRHHFTPSDVV